ncbi:uncharacterized protein A4U43_C08F11760 [Asparagus officinalis]|uniref:UPF0496 protein 1-like n=1 Tax=Asparagus officinalis TaxID=4686 RepID=UPI00098E83C0|nr:UPF0496 protein 1-like [Asparagus officinalis]ONK59866.1 uncharacterized protein A4U43_C08F11760 [Asparagus officinalis]
MMGSSFSKKPNSLSQGGGSSSSNSRSNHNSTDSDINGSSNGSSSNQYIRGLSSYQSDPHQDPELESFDSALQHRTIGAISMLAGSEINSISFNTLMEVTGCLLDNNQEVINMILEYKKDVWKNPELFDVVQEFFDCSLRILEFCTALEKCLKRARDSQLIIHIALKHSEEEQGEGKDKYKRTLEELQRFKNIGNPFTAEFFQAFRLVYSQQVSMFEKLKKNKKKLDKKMKSVKAWRRVSSIIFVSVFAAVLICSVVSAVMAAPAVAAALAAAAAVPLGSVGKWVDSLWKDYSKVLKGQKDVLNIMQGGTFVAISDLDSIRAIVERLEIHIGSLMQNVDIVLGDEEAVKFGIEEIKKKMEEFIRGVESLEKQVDRCSRDIQRVRTVVLQRIIRHPE